jgi:hypothetical protein
MRYRLSAAVQLFILARNLSEATQSAGRPRERAGANLVSGATDLFEVSAVVIAD